jgi:hypothetical protein
MAPVTVLHVTLHEGQSAEGYTCNAGNVYTQYLAATVALFLYNRQSRASKKLPCEYRSFSLSLLGSVTHAAPQSSFMQLVNQHMLLVAAARASGLTQAASEEDLAKCAQCMDAWARAGYTLGDAAQPLLRTVWFNAW